MYSRVKVLFDDIVQLKEFNSSRRILVNVDHNQHENIGDFLFYLVDRYVTYRGQQIGLFLEDFWLHPSEVFLLNYL